MYQRSARTLVAAKAQHEPQYLPREVVRVSRAWRGHRGILRLSGGACSLWDVLVARLCDVIDAVVIFPRERGEAEGTAIEQLRRGHFLLLLLPQELRDRRGAEDLSAGLEATPGRHVLLGLEGRARRAVSGTNHCAGREEADQREAWPHFFLPGGRVPD